MGEHAEQLRLERERAEQRRAQENADHEFKLVQKRAEAEQRLREESDIGEMKTKVEGRLRQLKEAGVNVTELLVAECRNPDRTIKVEGNSHGGLHLHDKAL